MGYEARESTLQAVSETLGTAADNLAMGGGTPPKRVQAGALTGVFAAMAADLARETEALTGQLGGASEAVASSSGSYAQVDEDAKARLRPPEEVPTPEPPAMSPGPAGGPRAYTPQNYGTV